MLEKIKEFLQKHGLVIISCIVSVSIIFFVIYDSRDSFLKIWKETNLLYVMLSLFVSGAIYVCMGMSLWEILKLLGKKIPVLDCINIAFVSTTVNYIVSTAGLSGFALRTHLLGKRGVPLSTSAISSMVITVLLYIVLFVIIIQGTLLYALSFGTSSKEMIKSFFAVIGIVLVGGAVTAFLLNNSFRYNLMRNCFIWLNRFIYKFFGKLIPRNNFATFAMQVNNGITTIHNEKSKMTGAIIYVCLDWILTILVLYLAFLAVGVKIGIGILLVGFAIGMATTLIPVLPGGLGAMEIAMATVFSRAGIDWDTALMAALIYRVIYYVIPGIMSVFIYWGLKISEPSVMKRNKVKEYIDSLEQNKAQNQ